jgi:hypothetical protein
LFACKRRPEQEFEGFLGNLVCSVCWWLEFAGLQEGYGVFRKRIALSKSIAGNNENMWLELSCGKFTHGSSFPLGSPRALATGYSVSL